MTGPRVLIIDDDEDVRDALLFLMKSVGQEAIAYASAKEFIVQYQGDLPGCIVCDIRMPGKSGLELQQDLIACGSDTPMIFITGHGDIPMAVEAIKAGAEEFLTKPFRDQDLLDAINAAIIRDQAQRSKLGEKADIDRRLMSLTRRERQVLDLVVAGKTNKLIAEELSLSHRTIEVHRSHMMEKMEVRTLVELLQLVQGEGGPS